MYSMDQMCEIEARRNSFQTIQRKLLKPSLNNSTIEINRTINKSNLNTNIPSTPTLQNTIKTISFTETQINKQNDEDSMVVNIRKRRLLQGNSITCEQINNKPKSETVSISNETLRSESEEMF